MAEVSKETQEKPTNKSTPSRDTEGVKNDKAQVSGQNHAASVPSDERDAKEQGEALARETEAELLAPDWAAGDDYLYPDLPVSAQNPPKANIIAYKTDPTGEAANS